MIRRSLPAATTVVALFATALAVTAVAAPAAPAGNDEEVRAVVQLYFDGLMHYDEVALRQAFHPDARLMSARADGTMMVIPFDEWVGFTGGEAPPTDGKVNRIVSVDVSDTAASVKTDLEWPDVHYVDYLSLLKVDGEWKIVNKIWWQETR